MNDLYDATMKALEGGLTVRLIGSMLKPDVGMVKMGCSDDDILRIALDRGFSQLFVYGDKENAEPPWWINEVALVDRVRQTIERRPIGADDLISDGATIEECLQIFVREKRTFYLLLGGHRLRQVITVADFDKLPVRVFLSTLLTHFEGLLMELIDTRLPNDKWLDLLNEPARTTVEALYSEKQKNDFETEKIICTTLTHKTTIIAKSELLRKALGFNSKNDINKFFKKSIRLRNRAAHNESLTSKSLIVEMTRDMEQLRDHLAHDQTLPQGKSIKWLAQTVQEIRELTKRLSEAIACHSSPITL
jgi:hypothetical protein